MRSPYTGFFTPRNPKKYQGNVQGIVYRSLLELRGMKYFDEHPDVLRWSSEETIIPYYDPVTQKWRRYFVDFQITCRTRAGEIVTYLVEVKPADQCVPPVPPKRKTAKSCANFENKINTYMTNSAKWQATEKVCEQKGWKFIKLTEQHLRYQK